MKVVIIGAGPAGLITALNLIQEGIRPLILEKQSEIRSSACGEACSIQSLSKIPFDSTPYICKFVKGAKFIYTNGAVSYMKKNSVTLDRTKWLKGMAQEVESKEGQIQLSSEVDSVGDNNIQLKNGERIDYDILIGADGPKSHIVKYLGISQISIVASQYKLAFNDSNMDFLEFYIDRRFSAEYSWIFPKNGIINVGTGGDFKALDTFLEYKGLSNSQILDKEAGVIPISGIQKLTQNKIVLIGDATSMVNPFSGAGLTPIIYAAQILVSNINTLRNYEKEVRRHPMANPVLSKARHALTELADKDMVNILRLITDPTQDERKASFTVRIIRSVPLLPKFRTLLNVYRAVKIAKNYGW